MCTSAAPALFLRGIRCAGFCVGLVWVGLNIFSFFSFLFCSRFSVAFLVGTGVPVARFHRRAVAEGLVGWRGAKESGKKKGKNKKKKKKKKEFVMCRSCCGEKSPDLQTVYLGELSSSPKALCDNITYILRRPACFFCYFRKLFGILSSRWGVRDGI